MFTNKKQLLQFEKNEKLVLLNIKLVFGERKNLVFLFRVKHEILT